MRPVAEKRIALAVGIGALLIIFVLGLLDSKESVVCGYWYVNGYPKDFCNLAALAISPFLLLIVFAPAFFFLQSLDAFYAWRRFSYWWLPLMAVMFFILASSNNSGGFGIESSMNAGVTLLVMTFLSLCYILISSAIVVRKWIRPQKSKF